MDFYYQLDIWEWVLAAGLFVSAVWLVCFYIRTYAGVAKFSSPVPNDEKKPVSVVLSGKNQYEMLKKNLTFWLEQKYPDFEVIVVYENSDEDVAGLLREFARRYDKLKLINANQSINFFDEQKFSLSIGVKSALNEYVIVSDPRFRPTGEHCIDYMQAAFTPKTKVVIGHPVHTEKKGGLCSFLNYRIVETAMQYVGFAVKGKPFAGHRALIAYRKSFFLENQGYSDIYALNTGMFDRILPHIGKREEASVQLAPDAEVRYTGVFGLNSVLKHERQYLNTLYSEHSPAKGEIKAYRMLIPFFYLFMAAGAAYFCYRFLNGQYPQFPLWFVVFAGIVLIKFVLQSIFMQRAANVLRAGPLWLCLPLYAILYLPLQLVLAFGKQRGRRRLGL
ncbi:MAG: hypothetical protein NC396_06730 [Bacteroides sp.]|nr:hypothetical protein [Bacteroides sp.]MCM1086052.1 hypothetical protein [Bacteroides sp.]